jgi:long-chain fatty acid transport protein
LIELIARRSQLKGRLILVGVLAGTLALSLFPPSSQAGGLILYDLGTPDVGLASAGYAARAEDASTLFKNPAGMSRFESNQLQVGAQVLYGDLGFVPDANTMVSGNDGGNPIGWFPGGGIFYVHNLSPKWAVGAGAFSYFGLGQEYNQGWVGRYYIQEGLLVGFTLMPSVSYKANDWLSFGAGLNAMYGVLDQKIAVNNILPILEDGLLELDSNTWGFGADLGVLVEPNETSRYGLTYISQVSMDFKANAKFSGLGPGLTAFLGNRGLLDAQLDLGMTVPNYLMASGYGELGENWAIMGNLSWQNWKEFGIVEVGVSDTTAGLTADLMLKDTWHVAGGARFNASDDWRVTAGVAYDSTPVDDENRSLAFALGEAYRFGAGVLWQVSMPVQLGLAYELAWTGDLPVDQERGLLAGRVSGVFESTAIHFLAFNVEWNFGKGGE